MPLLSPRLKFDACSATSQITLLLRLDAGYESDISPVKCHLQPPIVSRCKEVYQSAPPLLRTVFGLSQDYGCFLKPSVIIKPAGLPPESVLRPQRGVLQNRFAPAALGNGGASQDGSGGGAASQAAHQRLAALLQGV